MNTCLGDRLSNHSLLYPHISNNNICKSRYLTNLFIASNPITPPNNTSCSISSIVLPQWAVVNVDASYTKADDHSSIRGWLRNNQDIWIAGFLHAITLTSSDIIYNDIYCNVPKKCRECKHDFKEIKFVLIRREKNKLASYLVCDSKRHIKNPNVDRDLPLNPNDLIVMNYYYRIVVGFQAITLIKFLC